MFEGTTIRLAGIIDKVRAVRHNDDEVKYLVATVHITFDKEDGFVQQYGSKVSTDLDIPINVTSRINPGDVVLMEMSVATPPTGRFVPALEVGNEEEVDG